MCPFRRPTNHEGSSTRNQARNRCTVTAARRGRGSCPGSVLTETCMPGQLGGIARAYDQEVGHMCAHVAGLCPGHAQRVCSLTRAAPGQITATSLVCGLTRAAARAAYSTKKWRQGDFRPPTVCLTRVYKLRFVVVFPSFLATLLLLESPTPTILLSDTIEFVEPVGFRRVP